MEVEDAYDATHLHSLQDELKRLNIAAAESGLLAAPRRERATPPVGAKAAERTAGNEEARQDPDRGKARARRMLRMLGRIDGDDSPLVPGTNFTESGVLRLLAHLRKPRSGHHPFQQRLYGLLMRPDADGMRTSAGISVERLQRVGRQLEEIQARGWGLFQSRRAARRAAHSMPSIPPASLRADLAPETR